MALIRMEFRSRTLKRAVPVNVILPAEKFRGPFPTLYLLHGLTDNCSAWLDNTRIRLWAEESGLAVVMPSGENSFYLDILVRDGCLGDFGEYIGRELVDVTRELFPLSCRREDTFLAGLSMGGYGACRNALKYSETFGKAAILSGALIAFSMSFDDFVISFFTSGVDVQNISMYVYSMKRFNPSVNALSSLIVVMVTLILILANLIPAMKDKKNKKEEQY